MITFPDKPFAHEYPQRYCFRALLTSLCLLPLTVAAVENDTTWPTATPNFSPNSPFSDRPSAQPLPPPMHTPRQPPEDFVLPQAPRSEALRLDASKFQIKRIHIEGNTLLDGALLQSVIKPYENREISVNETEELREKLTHLYVDAGYINSGAIIPAGAYQDGELRIRIIEGRLDEVRIRGQEGLREDYIRRRLQIDSDEPLNLQALQDRFQLLLSDPLIAKMHGRLLPTSTLGHSLLDVDVVRARPYGMSLFGNNYRPPSIGAEAFGVNGWVRNLTGWGDYLDFTYTTSEGSNQYAGGASLPINDAGTLGFFRFNEGDSRIVEQPFKQFNIQSRIHTLEGGFSHPLINSLNQQLNLGVLLAVRRNATTFDGMSLSFQPTGEPYRDESQVTVWRTYQDYTQRFDRNVVALRSTFSVGMDALGSTVEKDARFPDSEFWAWLGQAQYAYLLHDNGTQLVFRGNSQFSNNPLLPLEQMAVGGVGTVRGYRENQLVRDEGYTLSLEFQYPIYDNPSEHHRLTLIPFMDYGEAWNHGYDADTLHSVGLGFNWRFKPVSLDVYYGYAIDRPRPEGHGNIQDDGLHFQMSLNPLEFL